MSATRHTFETDDHALAAKIYAVVVEHDHPAKTAAGVVHLASTPPPPPATSVALTPPTNGAAPPPVSAAPPAPPAPPSAPALAATPPPPPAPPTAAATPPPPPPPTSAAPPPPAADNGLGIAPAGWTLEHVKDAAGKFTANPAKGGAGALAEALRAFCAPGEARPSIKKIYPAYWPQAHAALLAP